MQGLDPPVNARMCPPDDPETYLSEHIPTERLGLGPPKRSQKRPLITQTDLSETIPARPVPRPPLKSPRSAPKPPIDGGKGRKTAVEREKVCSVGCAL